jgi:3D (Asp-Asp-Asp) domain-containing protein
MPIWFQRAAGALTLFGIVGLIHFVDASLRPAEEAASSIPAGARLDALALQDWSPRLGIGLREEPDTSASGDSGAGAGRPRLGLVPTLLRVEERSRPEYRFQLIQVTAYTSEAGQTDESPHLTATNRSPEAGHLAMSRDLLRDFSAGAPFGFGDRVLIPGVGVFEVTDTMHPRWKRKADIWVASMQAARSWGRRTVFVTRVSRDAPMLARRVG